MLTDINRALLSEELTDFIHTNEAKAIVMLRALGLDSAEITRVFSISAEAQEYLIESDELSNIYASYDVMTSESDKEVMERLARISLRVKANLLRADSTSDAMKNSIATEFLDRVHGKARQTLEQVNYTINASASVKEIDNLIRKEAKRLNMPDAEIEVLLSDGNSGEK